MSQKIIIGAHDPNIAYLLQRYAEESGYPSVHVRQSTEVSPLALALEPALVILDLDLAETADWQVMRQLRAEPITSNIPVVIYSCLDESPENLPEGIEGYLLKSAMYDDFVVMLERTGVRQPVKDMHPSAEQIRGGTS